MRSTNTFLRKLFYSAAAMVIASAAVSCDNIAEDDRYILVSPVVPERTVLIEDFTGQNCINCPEAHEVIAGLQNQYADKVIAVAIHGGAFAVPVKRTNFDRGYIGLASEEGIAYNTQLGLSSWPNGAINRNGTIYNYDNWASVVRTELQRPSELAINLQATLNKDGESDKVDIEVELLPQSDIEGYLQLWVVEDGIVAFQKFPGGVTQDNYVHNNVFRAAVNGLDGEEVALTKGMHTSASYSIEVRNTDKERWNAENLAIVAFVHNASGVQQAARAEVQVTL